MKIGSPLAALVTVALLCVPSNSQSASSYNTLCYGCINAGYNYCTRNSICTQGTSCDGTLYTLETGCPVTGYCENAGYKGTIFGGDKENSNGIDLNTNS